MKSTPTPKIKTAYGCKASLMLAALFCNSYAHADWVLRVPLKGLLISENTSGTPTPDSEPPKAYAKWDLVFSGSAAENTGTFIASDDKYSVFAIVPDQGRIVPVSQSTTCKTTGKWYWEISQGAYHNSYSGVSIRSSVMPEGTIGGLVHYYWGRIDRGATVVQSGLASVVGIGGTYGVALDADAKTVQFYWNGIPQGAPIVLPAAPAYCPGMSGQLYGSPAGSFEMTLNSGYAPFKYTPPDGYTTGIY